MLDRPRFTEKLGDGSWDGVSFVMASCPICCGDKTMKFTGAGMWGCSKCGKGGPDMKSFRAYAATDEMLKHMLDSFVDPEQPKGAINIAKHQPSKNVSVIASGFEALDILTGGMSNGALTVFTGKRSGGKSTFLGQLAGNAIEYKKKVCFYSGELSADHFQRWVFAQLAGPRHTRPIVDQFGVPRWYASDESDRKIRKWLGDSLLLYDNRKAKSSDRHTILRCFEECRAYYGSDLFIVDNLMTARYDIDNERDTLRAQANFAALMLDFARENNVHVVLVAHPKKGESEDINDDVSGLSDITNIASSVIQIKRLNERQKAERGCDTLLTVAKNRNYGDTGEVELNYQVESRRFIPKLGHFVTRYGWERVGDNQ